LNKGLNKKLIASLTIVLLVSAMFSFDYIRSKMFKIDVVSIMPNPAVADGQTPVIITVQLRDYKGDIVKGHSLYALSKTGGMFKSTREITNDNGIAEFIYFPFKASEVNEIRDAVINISDESNSVFIEIGTQTEFSIKLERPPKEKASVDLLLRGIFGE